MAGGVFGVAGDDGDAGVADVEQVAHETRARRAVLDQRAIDRQSHQVVIVDDDRSAAGEEFAHALGRFLVAVHDQAIDAMRGEEIERLGDRAAVVVVTVGEHCAPGDTHALAEILQDLGVKLAEPGDHETDGVGKVRLHRGRQRIPPIAEALDGDFDQFPVGRPHGQAVEVARDGTDRDARLVGDIDDRRRPPARVFLVRRTRDADGRYRDRGHATSGRFFKHDGGMDVELRDGHLHHAVVAAPPRDVLAGDGVIHAGRRLWQADARRNRADCGISSIISMTRYAPLSSGTRLPRTCGGP